MAKCSFCNKKCTTICGICERPMCDDHKHPVNRWHNAFHARWICESCYQAKEKRRKIVLVPILLLSAISIASTMDITWGLKEVSMWNYFLALADLALGIFTVALFYNIITRTEKRMLWLKRTIPVIILWLIIFGITRIL